MRARKPQQPTALRLLRGNPGKRPINRHEPRPAPLPVDCPDVLTDAAARAEWDRVAPGLIGSGQVTTIDRATLIGYCQKYAQWQALEREAAQHPFLVRAPSGYPMPNPALGMANKAFNLMLRAAAELGMTPSGRSRVSVVPSAAAGAVNAWADVLP
jgi:P27 family predicted phage terminase small subunit